MAGSSLKIHDTRKFNNTWQGPTDPFCTTFTSPDQLTTENNNGFFTASALWSEGSSPYTIKFGIAFPGVIGQTNVQISPSINESYEGEKRVANMTGMLFAFYYDGSNVIYRTSRDGGFGATLLLRRAQDKLEETISGGPLSQETPMAPTASLCSTTSNLEAILTSMPRHSQQAVLR
jgi:hypothetical protein